MRLLHTSDWHLGQNFYDHDRSQEHQAFLDWLLDAIRREQPDALLIAGDVFDTANPPAASQRMFYRFLRQAREVQPRMDIIAIAGNHDSASRLEAPQPLLEESGTVLVGAAPRTVDGAIDIERLILPLHDAKGAVAAWCLAVPFLRPGDVPRIEGECADPYQAGIAALYQQATTAAMARRVDQQALVAMGHLHLASGQVSENSERRIVIGGSEAVPDTLFGTDIDYVALGHLHRVQRIGGRAIHYSGSPLPMSFSEIDYPHQVLCIELERGRTEVRSLPVPRSVGLLQVPKAHAPLSEVLAALRALEPEACPYLEVRVLLDAPEPGLGAQVREAIKDKNVRLARIDPRRTTGSTVAAPLTLDELRLLSPESVFQRLYSERFDHEPEPELLQAFQELLHAEDA